MRSTWVRTLGFAIPTFTVVVALHLARQATLASAFDGVVSATWFVAFFGIGAGVAHFAGFAPKGVGAANGLLTGAGAGVAVWTLLWALWAIPLTSSLRLESGVVLTVNTLSMTVAALAVSCIRRFPRSQEINA